jgi:GAF domain-containing protein/HAMP domain-containing protein
MSEHSAPTVKTEHAQVGSNRPGRNISLRLKLMIPLAAIAILSLTTLAYVLLNLTLNAVEEQAGTRFVSHAEDHADQILSLFLEQVGQLQVLALSDPIRTAVTTRNASYRGNESQIVSKIQNLDSTWAYAPNSHPLIQQIISNDETVNPASYVLHDFLNTFPSHTEVFITDKYGATVASTARLSDYYQADEEWWQKAWNNGRGNIYISEPQFDESANTTALLIALPLFDQDKLEIIGILRTTLKADALERIIAEDILGETGHSVLFNRDGIVIFDPRAETTNSAQLPTEIILEIIQAEPSYHVETDQHGNKFLFGHVSLEQHFPEIAGEFAAQQEIVAAVNNLGWVIIFRQDASEAFNLLSQQAKSTILISLGVLVVFLFATAGISQLFLNPISNLKSTAEQIAKGDLTKRARVESRDEVGQLASAFNSMTAQLEGLIGGLEDRVAERTVELENANSQISRRADQFEAIAQVSKTISSVQNINELLPRITKMISQYFGFYHVGIFLLDDTREFAELRAANSEGGERMLARNHRLRVGQVGIVGNVTETGNPRIALDVGTDAVYFDNPDLPNTRSEMALPLKFGNQIIGALDVQSTDSNAFSDEDANILSILADLVSTAIQNARLFEESRRSLAEAETAYRQLTRMTWVDIKRQVPLTGYRFDGLKTEPLTDHQSRKRAKNPQTLEVPVQLRGVTIGKLHIKPPAGKTTWSQDEIAISNAIAERVALAAENARLIMDSQKRAAKEQTIGEISSEIGASVNLDNILRTAVREMGRLLPGAEVSIQVRKEE